MSKKIKMSSDNSNRDKEARKRASGRMPGGKGLKVTCKGSFRGGRAPAEKGPNLPTCLPHWQLFYVTPQLCQGIDSVFQGKLLFEKIKTPILATNSTEHI